MDSEMLYVGIAFASAVIGLLISAFSLYKRQIAEQLMVNSVQKHFAKLETELNLLDATNSKMALQIRNLKAEDLKELQETLLAVSQNLAKEHRVQIEKALTQPSEKGRIDYIENLLGETLSPASKGASLNAK